MLNDYNFAYLDDLAIECSAPGKVIISGEHFIVHKSKGISCCIDLFTNSKILITHTQNFNYIGEDLIVHLPNIEEKLVFNKKNINQVEFFLNYLNSKINSTEDFYNTDKLLEIIYKEPFENFSSLITGYESMSKANLHFLVMFNIIFSFVSFSLKFQNKILNKLFSFNKIEMNVNSNIPHDAGLGSSSAYNVSIVTTLLKLADKVYFRNNNNKIIKNKEMLNKIISTFSYFGEKYFHSNPSGIDHLTIINGGLLFIDKIQNPAIFKKMKNANQIKLLQNMYIIDTNIRRETKELISKAKNFKSDFEFIFNSSINMVNYIIEEHFKLFNSCVNESNLDNFNRFTRLIETNQNILDIIQVSLPEINYLINLLKQNHIPAKITGAGGGGFLIAFLKNSELHDSFMNLMQENKYKAIKVNIVEDSIISKY